MNRPEIVTIGVYGWEEGAYFAALQAAGIDTFVDVRARRGLRGSEYAFANSQRLQARLAELGIRYVHHPELAPTAEARASQHRADDAAHVARRQRTALSEEFVRAYLAGPLAGFDSQAFVDGLGGGARRVVLMCVEREPSACHRGLLADRLKQDLRLEVNHLTPCNSVPSACPRPS